MVAQRSFASHRYWPLCCGLPLVVGGVVLGGWLARDRELPKAFAVTSQSDDKFAVCTVTMDGNNVEAFFMLDFDTGDISGGVLNPLTGQFGGSYKHNVLKDLGFKPGQAKNPKFLLVSGLAALTRPRVAQSVLYVTDSSTGTTAAYAIPWNAQQPQGVSPLELLNVVRPRGGGPKAP